MLLFVNNKHYFRTAELIESAITIPMAITAFMAALLGGIMAPIVGDGMRALMEFELPEFELPRIKKAGSGKKFDYAVRSVITTLFSGRDYDDVFKPVSSLFKLAAEKMVTNAIKKLQEAQWKKILWIPWQTNEKQIQTTEYKTCRLTKNQNEDWTDLKVNTVVEVRVKDILDKKRRF